jgi:mRNA interferase YafQ
VLEIYITNQFKKDYKKLLKNLTFDDIHLFHSIIIKLQNKEKLNIKYKDHELQGKIQNIKNVRDCHIKPDWLLLYKIIDNQLNLIRTGSHSELF